MSSGFWITAWPLLLGLIVGVLVGFGMGFLIRHFIDPIYDRIKANKRKGI